MEHIVYLDSVAGEYEKLKSGEKSMIIRGAAGRKIPYGRVFEGDTLFFIRNNGEGFISGKCKVNDVYNSSRLSPEENISLLESYKDKLCLAEKQKDRWKGKRYLVLVSVVEFEETEPFRIDKSAFRSMDDWLPVGAIDKYRIE